MQETDSSVRTSLVLVVDDDPGSREVVAALLPADRYRVVEAADGYQAIDLAGREAPDVVVLDVMMPGIDGFEVCRRLRQDAHLAAVPIVLLTTLDDRESRLEGLAAGADDFLTKPVDRLELRTRLATITRLNRFRRLHEEAEQRRVLEAQLLQFQRLELLGQFAGGIVHDFNNVLTPVLSIAEYLRDNIAAEQREWTQHLIDCAVRGRELCQQLLMFARGGSGKKVPLDVHVLVHETVKLLDTGMPPEIRMVADAPEEMPRIRAERSQLHQVLMNLAVNASDAMDGRGSITLRARTTVVDAAAAAARVPAVTPGTFVVLEVEDTGPGIPPKVLARLFEPFFTTKPRGKGTGLGLATVLRLTQGHEGFVTVDSTVGKGTRFSVHLPAMVD